ncbi:MAG: hypothetical protein Q7S74_05245 [Nanoarchaeota archaeon]|nr:hypothetical protein [Nanoarchaeota archaeon]
MPQVNHLWAAKVLGMELNNNKGPDLINASNDVGVELKFMLSNRSSNGWTVQNHQLRYKNNNFTCYWGLGIYNLDRNVKEIDTEDKDRLEGMVVKREIYIVNYNWMNQFAPSRTSGGTGRSKWNYVFRYAKFKSLPRIVESYEVDKGIVHITRGVREEDFFMSRYLTENSTLY